MPLLTAHGTPHRPKRRPAPRVAFVRPRDVTPTRAFNRPRRCTSTRPRRSRSNGWHKPRISSDYFDLEGDTLINDGTDAEDERRSEADSESCFFPWDDETSMFSDLMDDTSPGEFRSSKFEELVSRVQPSFDVHGKKLKKEIADAFVPAVNHVKALHCFLNDRVDIAYTRSLLAMNNACKGLETTAVKEQDEIKDASITLQASIEDLFGRLRIAYQRREQLWVEYENAKNAIVEPLSEKLKALPEKMDRAVATLDKHSKKLEKRDDAAVSALDIREILGKVA